MRDTCCEHATRDCRQGRACPHRYSDPRLRDMARGGPWATDTEARLPWWAIPLACVFTCALICTIILGVTR